MKKILFIIPTLGGGGAERVLVNLVNSLDKNEYQVTVQTIFDIGINRKNLNENIKYIPGFRKQFIGNSKILKLFSTKFLYKYFIKEKYDIIVSYLEGPTARIVAGCDDKNCKLICWIHIEQQNPKKAGSLFRSPKEAIGVYSRFDKIVCVSETVKQDFDNIFQNIKNSIVLYNTNDTQKILQSAKENIEEDFFSNEINVISVGRLMEQKGYDRLINAHKKLLEENIKHHIYVLGTGKKQKELQNQIEKLNLTETFHLVGFKENPYKYMSKADLFVCSSRREGFSTAITESLVLGVPVVSTNCSGAYELLGKNNEYGIVEENSEKGIYKGLKKILTTENLISTYKEKAIIRGKDFETDKTTAKVEKFLKELYS